jgi:spore maturation protein CgeB
MKILLVSDFGSPHRDAAIAEGFRLNNCFVAECPYGDLLYDRAIYNRIQFRASFGPVFSILLRRVVNASLKFEPDIIFFRRPLEFSSAMLRRLRKARPVILASFNNDDPFSTKYNDIRWRRLRKAIPDFDIHFAFRDSNISQYTSSGAKVVKIFEPFYTPWIHCPSNLEDSNCNFHFLFAMHAEDDERRHALLSLLDNGFSVKIHSWNWSKVFGNSDVKHMQVKPPIWGVDYVNAISAASATLCFFSKQNNDELTSRVFEIPASGGLLLSWRSKRLMELFKDKEEAFFFSSINELLEIAHYLQANPRVVKETKLRGRERLLNSRHSVVDRCQDALKAFSQISE